MTRANFLQGLIHHENKKRYGIIGKIEQNVHLPSIQSINYLDPEVNLKSAAKSPKKLNIKVHEIINMNAIDAVISSTTINKSPIGQQIINIRTPGANHRIISPNRGPGTV